MSAEYIMSSGQRAGHSSASAASGTFETATRNTLDISAIPLIKRLSHLPVIVDPSHATGTYTLVPPLAKPLS